MNVQLKSGKNVVDVQSLNVTLNRGDNWTKIQKIDFGSANVTFVGRKEGGSTYKYYASSTALTEFTGGKMVNTNTFWFFSGCSNLTKVSMNMTNVTDGERTFYQCGKLTDVSIGSMNKLSRGYMFFYQCSSLTSVANCGTFPELLTANCMFMGCGKLTAIYMAPTKVKYVGQMFDGCSALTTVTLGALNSVSATSCMFRYCYKLSSLHSTHLTTPNVTTADEMFYGCSSLTYVSQSVWSALTNGNSMFKGCIALTGNGGGSFVTTALTAGSQMYYNCSALTFNSVGHWYADSSGNNRCGTKIYYMNSMFYNCQKLRGFYGFDLTNVTDMTNTFYNCKSCHIFGMTNLGCDCDLSYTRLGRTSHTDDTYQAYYIQYIVANAKTVTNKTLKVPKWLESNADAKSRFNNLVAKGWTVEYVQR